MYVFAARLISNSNKTKFPTKSQYIGKCFEVVCCKLKSKVLLLTACIEHETAEFPTKSNKSKSTNKLADKSRLQQPFQFDSNFNHTTNRSSVHVAIFILPNFY